MVRRARERRAEVPSPLRRGRSWVARFRPPHLRPLGPHSCRGLAELELPATPALGLCVFPPSCTPIFVVHEGSLGFRAPSPLGARPRSGPPAFSPGLVSAVGQHLSAVLPVALSLASALPLSPPRRSRSLPEQVSALRGRQGLLRARSPFKEVF